MGVTTSHMTKQFVYLAIVYLANPYTERRTALDSTVYLYIDLAIFRRFYQQVSQILWEFEVDSQVHMSNLHTNS